jgi:hypothetical protein
MTLLESRRGMIHKPVTRMLAVIVTDWRSRPAAGALTPS